MSTQISTGVFWFRHDLRLHDNPTFNRLCVEVDQLICVFVNGCDKSAQHSIPLGQHRQLFLAQSLTDLDGSLRQKQQFLMVLDGDWMHGFTELIRRYQVTHFAASQHPGVFEQAQWQMLKNTFPALNFISEEGHTLYTQQQLPFALSELPTSFTPFRKKLESVSIDKPIVQLLLLPKAVISAPEALPNVQSNTLVLGGESQALKQLQQYLFETDNVATYKKKRNALDDWGSSSKLSFWLANGCLSVKTVYQQLQHYETNCVANESTYWLFFELLWREYFQWYLLAHQSKLFQFCGVKGIKPDTEYDALRFAAWCEGQTDYPIVNACMRQLNQTGYMSNRGRQLVASCLVHELHLDWRYGAKYFEQHLIDFDVASNWGNWLYLAGVGADPRGHRRFDLLKQSQIYDPQGEFQQKWLAGESE